MQSRGVVFSAGPHGIPKRYVQLAERLVAQRAYLCAGFEALPGLSDAVPQQPELLEVQGGDRRCAVRVSDR